MPNRRREGESDVAEVLSQGASGFTCPRCGGAIWEHDGGGSTSFECRIGDRFSEAEMWIEHCATRNRAILTAARALAENAALARRIAASAERRGDAAVAARLEAEAQEEDRLYAQVRAMVDGLSEDDLDGTA
jgi:two-component system chemotaxis response regulator CheB